MALATSAAEDHSRVLFFLTDASEELTAFRAVIGGSSSGQVVSIGLAGTGYRNATAIAAASHGAVIDLSGHEDATPMLASVIDRLSHPALTDLSFDWKGTRITEVFPQPIVNLLIGRPVRITGRFLGPAPTTLSIVGRQGSQTIALTTVARPLPDMPPGTLASAFAKMKLADLVCRGLIKDDPALPEQVRQIALEFGLLSRYTASICVDARAPVSAR
jgi:Ca-activated chloride channel family protein